MKKKRKGVKNKLLQKRLVKKAEIRKKREQMNLMIEKINEMVKEKMEKGEIEPTKEKYGYVNSTSLEEESGWTIEGGEEAYYEALKEWDNKNKEI